jgi:hypothetical protein
MSMPMIALTGACRVFSVLPGVMHSSRRAFASGEATNTMRAGLLLADVGPHFIRSQSWRNLASGIGSGRNPLCVRACSKSCSVVTFMAAPRDRGGFGWEIVEAAR